MDKDDMYDKAYKDALKTVEAKVALVVNEHLPAYLYKSRIDRDLERDAEFAAQVVREILRNPLVNVRFMAGVIHDAWLEKNHSWSPQELKNDYSHLPYDAQMKYQSIVRQASAAISYQTALEVCIPPDNFPPKPTIVESVEYVVVG